MIISFAMTNRIESKNTERSLSLSEIQMHSQILLGQYFQRLMEISEAKLAVEEAESDKKPFSYNLGPWQFEGKIDLKHGELVLSRKTPDNNDQDGEFDHVMRVEISPTKISYAYTINKADSSEIIRAQVQSTNTYDALTQAYDFNIVLGETPSEPEDY